MLKVEHSYALTVMLTCFDLGESHVQTLHNGRLKRPAVLVVLVAERVEVAHAGVPELLEDKEHLGSPNLCPGMDVSRFFGAMEDAYGLFICAT